MPDKFNPFIPCVKLAMVMFVEVVVEVVTGLSCGSFSFAGWSEEKRNSWRQIKLEQISLFSFFLSAVGARVQGEHTTPKPSTTPIPYLHEGIPVSCV